MNKSNILHFILFMIAVPCVKIFPWYVILPVAAILIELDQAVSYNGYTVEGIKSWFKTKDTKYDLIADLIGLGAGYIILKAIGI